MSAADPEVVVLGAGAAGVAAACAAHEAGARTALVGAHPGATGLGSGVLLGGTAEALAVAREPAFRAGGRYVTVAGWLVTDALGALSSLLDVSRCDGPVGVLDLDTHPSWSAALVAQSLGGVVVPASPETPSGETFCEVASRLDTLGLAEGVAASLRARCRGLAGLLFPPVLGLHRLDVAATLSRVLGLPVGEAAGGAGDPPGVRVERALQARVPAAVLRREGRATVHPGRRPEVRVGTEVLRPRAVVLATGGLTGGGLVFGEQLQEALLGAPLWVGARARVPVSSGASRGADPSVWFAGDPPVIATAGLRVDGSGRVLDGDGTRGLHPWLFAAGEVLSSVRGATLGGALVEGLRAGAAAARVAREG
ncbi:MAG: hypothetical protein HY909_09040 [Deltaproteobacteria bacterium]|nr:hypothetical protein [Deltaproteobacteria bacterium]